MQKNILLMEEFLPSQFDRMAADCGLELKSHNVTYISLCPGAVKTEKVLLDAAERKDGGGTAKPASTETLKLGNNEGVFDKFIDGESAEFSGKVIAALATGG